MPVCPNCGNNAADNALFCDQCGTKLAAAEAPAPVEAAVDTPAGGIPQDIVICPACGAENVPGEVFCDSCGEPLEAPEPVAAEVVVEESPAAEPVVEAELVVEETAVEMEVVEEAEEAEAVVEEVEEAEAVVEEAEVEDVDESYCPVCGASVHPDDTFCGSCGASLSADAEQSWDEEPEEELVEEPVPETIVPEEVAPEELVVEELVEEVVPEEPVLESEPADIEETVVEEVVVEEAVIEEPVVEEVVVEETVVEEPTEPVCPVCGAKVLADQVFCASCGAKLQESAAPEPVAEPPSVAPVIAAPTGPYLAVVASGARIPLVEQPESLVGRTDDVSGIYPDVDMTPHGGEEGGVSRRHARLIFEGGNWFVEDLDSTNGTYVNEAELAPKTRTALSDGDAVSFGDVEMTFHLG